MSLIVEIRSDSKFPVDRKVLRVALQTAWGGSETASTTRVSILVVGTRKMRALCEQYLERSDATQVLTFPQQGTSGNGYGFVSPTEGPLELGDIVLCYPLILDEAAKRGVLVDEVVTERALHGMRQLMGGEEE